MSSTEPTTPSCPVCKGTGYDQEGCSCLTCHGSCKAPAPGGETPNPWEDFPPGGTHGIPLMTLEEKKKLLPGYVPPEPVRHGFIPTPQPTPAQPDAATPTPRTDADGERVVANACLLRLFRNEYRESSDRHNDALYAKDYVTELDRELATAIARLATEKYEHAATLRQRDEFHAQLKAAEKTVAEIRTKFDAHLLLPAEQGYAHLRAERDEACRANASLLDGIDVVRAERDRLKAALESIVRFFPPGGVIIPSVAATRVLEMHAIALAAMQGDGK